MVKAGPDSRLLENLLKAEKTAQESFKQWTKDASAASVALSAWAVADSGETPDLMETSMRIGTLLGTCADSQRTYIDALTSYRASLKDVLMRESDIRTILRDREILVSRLITLSKKKPTDAKSDLHAARLEDAKRELGACEATLKAEEWGLMGVKRRVLRDAFGMRMRSLGELGVVLEESAKSAIELLDQLGVERPEGGPAFEEFRSEFANQLVVQGQEEHLPIDHGGSHEGSIAPSQSASQVARRAAGYAASVSDVSSDVDVHIPSAHSLNNNVDGIIPLATRRISSSAASLPVAAPRAQTPPPPEDSSDDERDFRQKMTAHKGGGAGLSSKRGKAKSSRASKAGSDDSDATATQKAVQPRDRSSGGFWSSFASLFKNRPARSGYDSDDEPRRNLGSSINGKWATRTDANIKVARRNTITSGGQGRSRAKADSSDEEVDPRSLVRVVNNVGLPARSNAKKRSRSNSIAAEIYNPPLVPQRQKAMSDIGPVRPGIMKKTEPLSPVGPASPALSRSNSTATSIQKKKKKRVPTQPTIPENAALANKTLGGNDARWSTGTWVNQPGAKSSNSMMNLVGENPEVLAEKKTSRTYTGANKPGEVAPSGTIKKKKKAASLHSTATAPAATASSAPPTTLVLPTAPPRLGQEGLPVMALPTAPPRISALDIAPALPPPVSLSRTTSMSRSVTSSSLAPPLSQGGDTSTLGRRKSVRIADSTSPGPASVRSPSPAPPQPILRATSPTPNGHADASLPKSSTWASRIGEADDVSSDEDDQGAAGASEYINARRAMAKTTDELSEKAKGKQRAE